MCVCVRVSVCVSSVKRPLFSDFSDLASWLRAKHSAPAEPLKESIVDWRLAFFKLSPKNFTENYC